MRFGAIRPDSPTLFSFSRCTHAHAKWPSVRGMHTECELNIQTEGIPSNVFLACVQKVSLFHGLKRLKSRSRGLLSRTPIRSKYTTDKATRTTSKAKQEGNLCSRGNVF